MKESVNQRHFALVTGLALVAMTIVAGLIMGTIYAPIFAMDSKEFVNQYATLKSLLTFGIFGWVVILICDIAVSWGLYKFYSSCNIKKSLLMGALRMMYSIILLIAIIQLVRANMISNDAGKTFGFIRDFESIWQFGLIVFGIHLLYLAPLVWEKRFVKMAISVALFIAGVGYVLSNTLDLFILDDEQMRSNVEAVFILPMIFGELGLAIWLLIKGGKDSILAEKQFVSELG